MKTLIGYGTKTINEPENYEARANLCWAVHKLTAFYGLDHTRSLAVVLGARYKYSINSKREKLEKLGKELFELSNLDGDLEQICVEKIVEFFESLGVLTHLKAYNIYAKDAADKILAQCWGF